MKVEELEELELDEEEDFTEETVKDEDDEEEDDLELDEEEDFTEETVKNEDDEEEDEVCFCRLEIV